jgi:hypothetical protein
MVSPNELNESPGIWCNDAFPKLHVTPAKDPGHLVKWKWESMSNSSTQFRLIILHICSYHVITNVKWTWILKKSVNTQWEKKTGWNKTRELSSEIECVTSPVFTPSENEVTKKASAILEPVFWQDSCQERWKNGQPEREQHSSCRGQRFNHAYSKIKCNLL